MLRISVLNEQGLSRIKLEGKLSREWVDEAENAWTLLRRGNGGNSILIDLFAVSYVDSAGHGLLAAMHNAGAELIGGGLLISTLIAEIKAQNSVMIGRSGCRKSSGLEVKHDC